MPPGTDARRSCHGRPLGAGCPGPGFEQEASEDRPRGAGPPSFGGVPRTPGRMPPVAAARSQAATARVGSAAVSSMIGSGPPERLFFIISGRMPVHLEHGCGSCFIWSAGGPDPIVLVTSLWRLDADAAAGDTVTG